MRKRNEGGNKHEEINEKGVCHFIIEALTGRRPEVN